MDEQARAPTPAALLRRQAAAAAFSMVRPRSYTGLAREAALSSFHLWTYPLGLLPGVSPSGPADVRDADAVGAAAAVREGADVPVVLVHGYVHNRSAFLVMSRALRQAGYSSVHAFNYNPLQHTLDALARLLAADVARVLDRTGAEQVHLVGHSMGGIIARHYVQMLGGEDTVATCVTLGAPHRGSYTSYLGMGPAAYQLRPGSVYLRRLEESAHPMNVRWLAYYSDLDFMVVPAVHGKLDHPAFEATNTRVRDTGHLSLLLSREVLQDVIAALAGDDGKPESGEGGGASRSSARRRRRRTRRLRRSRAYPVTR